MPLQKQLINIAFNQGLDTKSDPFQIELGKFLSLSNSVFGKAGALVKRNGFPLLTNIGNTEQTTLLNYNNNLLATGSSLYAYSSNSNTWINQGSVQPVSLEVKPLVRTSGTQSINDCVVAPNGLACTVYKEASSSYYIIHDSITGQVIIDQTTLPGNNARVFVLNNNFIITYVTTTPTLRFISIPIYSPNTPSSGITIASTIASSSATYDGLMLNNKLYISFDASDVGNAIRTIYISPSFVVSSASILSTYTCNRLSLFSDSVNLWIAFWDSTSNKIRLTIYTPNLISVLSPTDVVTNSNVNQITGVAKNATASIAYQITTTYSYNSIRTDAIKYKTVTSLGVVGSETTIKLGAGIISKAFYDDNGNAYFLANYNSQLQPTDFLMDFNGNIIMKLAPATGGGYIDSFILPNVTKIQNDYYVSYLYQTALVPVNKTIASSTSLPFYTQIGVNLAKFSINQSGQYNAEIASTINLTGGITWMYDTSNPVELGFNVYPENLKTTPSTSGGNMSAQAYYYSATYEWTDAQGMLHRSAPSVPIIATVSSGTTGSVVIDIPMLRLTYKTNVRIVLYRYSVAQPISYQVTSVSAPIINSTSTNSYQYTDTLADSAIIGNPILYTTGGVLENIAPPSSCVFTLFKSRLFMLTSENRNLLWYSKPVLQATPVEMSDFQTIYIPPTIGNNQSSTGVVTALCTMDDKLIIFKQNSIFYITGNGPDITGANNDFSEATFITSTVGCSNQASIVLTPNGIMFQSNKGIWLLSRDLSTKYIGADVERYNAGIALSALLIPNSNEVRFVLNTGITLLYDYYYNQWSTFEGYKAISATLYNQEMTCLDAFGSITQEKDNSYVDNSKPVLLSFTTGWIKLSSLQNFQRAYALYLLGTYKSPHKLSVSICYDYVDTPIQTSIIEPTNDYTIYGDEPLYGNGSVYGGTDALEQWRVFLQLQKCQALKITLTEHYDNQYNSLPGAGLTISNLSILAGLKDNKPKIKASNSVG